MNIRALVIAGLILVGTSFTASAQTWSITRSVIGSGMTPTSGGGYVLDGTIGQAIIGPAVGSNFTALSGFWYTLVPGPLGVATTVGGPAGFALEQNYPNPFNSTTTSFAAIERVYSHPQPLGQCRVWLAKNLGSAILVQSPSTAAAVREAMNDPGSAAIASRLASELYGLSIMRERIQDHPENFTRFIVISEKDAARTGDDKTTIAFSLRDGQGRGALLRVLTVLDEEGINLCRIESRPSREKPWDYVFLAEMLGHRDDDSVSRVMSRLREKCPLVKHLGSYPRARRAA
jgi:hypothetical protein